MQPGDTSPNLTAAAGRGRPIPQVWQSIAWFAAAAMLTTIAHEAVHGCVAYALGVPSTLFNYSVNLNLARTEVTVPQRALIGAAGPVFCLGLGVLAWAILRRARGSEGELPLVYFTVFGVGTFFGNLMSISFVGDFSSVARALNLPMWVRYAASAVGALAIAGIHFWGGRQLVRWGPANSTRLGRMISAVAIPAVCGTALVMLVNLPMPPASVTARLAEAGFWLFAVAGALTVKGDSPGEPKPAGLRWPATALLLAVLLVRLAVRGIPLTP